MTAGTATLGLLPMLVLNLHGTEIERPLAVVMIGGLMTSTLFTLLVLPTFYLQVHGWLERRALRPRPTRLEQHTTTSLMSIAVALSCGALLLRARGAQDVRQTVIPFVTGGTCTDVLVPSLRGNAIVHGRVHVPGSLTVASYESVFASRSANRSVTVTWSVGRPPPLPVKFVPPFILLVSTTNDCLSHRPRESPIYDLILALTCGRPSSGITRTSWMTSARMAT